MGTRTTQYSVLALSRFNVYILKHDVLSDNTTIQKIFVLKCQDNIQAAVLTPSSSYSSSVIIASTRSIWEVRLPEENTDCADRTSRPVKRRKTESQSSIQDDIFADLLGQEEKQNLEDDNCYKPNESVQTNVFSLTLSENHLLCTLDSDILAITAFDRTLIALVDDKDLGLIRLFNLEQHLAICFDSFETDIDTRFFHQDHTAKSLHLIQQSANFEGRESREKIPSQAINLPGNLFALLFGAEAACLKSPVVLLCDNKGCVYFYSMKSREPALKKLSLLCEAGSAVVCVSVIELENQPLHGALKNKDVISLLESALDREESDKVKNNSDISLISGLVIIGEAGQGYLFVPDEVITEVLVFSLPHSTQCCILRGNCLFYLTDNSIEACDLSLIRQEDNSLRVTAVAKLSLFKGRMRHLISVAYDQDDLNGDMIIGVSEDFELTVLPASKMEQPFSTCSNSHSHLDSYLKSVPPYTDNIQEAQDHIDLCLLQLNLFASIVKQKDTSNLDDIVGEEIVTCQCVIKSYSNLRTLFFQIQLNNFTSEPFTNDWKVDVSICQKAENVSVGMKHFVVPLNQGLPSKSSKEIFIPIMGPSACNMHPFYMTVSLVLALNPHFSSMKTLPPQIKKALSVQIHEQFFDALDYLHLSNHFNPVTDFVRTDGLDCSPWQGCSNPELTTRLFSLSRPWKNRIHQERLRFSSDMPLLTLAIGVLESLCQKLDLHRAEDVIKLLLGRFTATAQISFTIPAGGISVSLAVSEEPQCKDDSNKKKFGQKSVAYAVTLRSTNLSLLIAIRASVMARLEKSKQLIRDNSDEDCLPSSSKLAQQLQKCQRLQESLHTVLTNTRSPASSGSFSENVQLLCDLLDSSALIG
ncbi:hypothetical protein PoB_002412100 [Plakobranchus ocellatus]|uniref:Fanconi anemia group B protein n=1 Tax=Plakobranchus ocellatus TaxID=259542 RepID=A0AAV3ZSY0_9GAST|nr:hypothetical protein PoB_002412100 [Plakobranchus ocellatus]